MIDPLGLIGPLDPTLPALTNKVQQEGPGFKQLLQEQIDKVNELQRAARRRRQIQAVDVG